MKKAVVSTANAPKAVGPYSQAIFVDGWLHISMQLPLVPETGALVEGDIKDKARQVFRNIGALLQEAGGGYGDLVKTTLYLVDMADFAAVNEVYAEFLPLHPPARGAMEVKRLPKDASLAIEAVAKLA